ncbi:hypothetical protein Tco_1572115 [Tanacetum coccineum]
MFALELDKEIVVANKMGSSSVSASFRRDVRDGAERQQWDDLSSILKELKKKMTDKYCPRTEIKKLEVELWDLKSLKILRYVGGLPDMIHRSVVASKPKTMQEATEIATEVMDKRIRTFVEH